MSGMGLTEFVGRYGITDLHTLASKGMATRYNKHNPWNIRTVDDRPEQRRGAPRDLGELHGGVAGAGLRVDEWMDVRRFVMPALDRNRTRLVPTFI